MIFCLHTTFSYQTESSIEVNEMVHFCCAESSNEVNKTIRFSSVQTEASYDMIEQNGSLLLCKISNEVNKTILFSSVQT
ncbi:hypothetical protein ACOMHN_000519 [Nucella lapillus]